MRFEILILLGILLISFTSANGHSSSTATDFNIGGCNFNFKGEIISVTTGTCSTGEASGKFFCDNNYVGWVTTDSGLGCSRGQTSYTLGDGSCCPPGMFCNETGTEQFQCVRDTENCIDQLNKGDCEAIDCMWLNTTGKCVDGPGDLSCGYYDTDASCIADVYDLGKNGIGTNLCGTITECQGETYSIPKNGCSCEWYPLAPTGKECQVKLIGVQTFYNATPNKFECSNSYSLGDCVDGKQNVSWTSSSSVINGSWGSVPEDCLDAFNCNGGESERRCGGPIIKLPGFSLFSLFASLGIIGLYFFLRKDLNKRND